MLDKMKEFVACGEDEIEYHAEQIMDLQENFEDGFISKEEYKELLQDIETTVEVNSRCKEVELKANFIKALSLISKAL